jgi:hypothetical protein
VRGVRVRLIGAHWRPRSSLTLCQQSEHTRMGRGDRSAQYWLSQVQRLACRQRVPGRLPRNRLVIPNYGRPPTTLGRPKMDCELSPFAPPIHLEFSSSSRRRSMYEAACRPSEADPSLCASPTPEAAKVALPKEYESVFNGVALPISSLSFLPSPSSLADQHSSADYCLRSLVRHLCHHDRYLGSPKRPSFYLI